MKLVKNLKMVLEIITIILLPILSFSMLLAALLLPEKIVFDRIILFIEAGIGFLVFVFIVGVIVLTPQKEE